MNQEIKIGIAEDHALFRKGTISLLKPWTELNVVFAVGNGKELLEVLKIKRVDVLLLDIDLPILTGKDVLKIIKPKYPNLKIIIVSAYFEKKYILEFFRLGVHAFLSKDYETEQLVNAISIVNEKGGYANGDVAKILIDEIALLSNTKEKKPVLSRTEIEVLKLVCAGQSYTESAAKLGIKPGTVNFHRRNIMIKTNSKNIPDLVRYAIKNKFIKS